MGISLYELSFTYQNNEGNHYFQVGYFSSIQKVHEVICALQNKPGFKDYQEGFFCNQIEVEEDKDGEEATFYELSYEEYNDMDGFDYSEIIGVFSSFSSANKKQQALLNSSEGNYSSEGFFIAPFKIDTVGWTEGFDSW